MSWYLPELRFSGGLSGQAWWDKTLSGGREFSIFILYPSCSALSLCLVSAIVEQGTHFCKCCGAIPTLAAAHCSSQVISRAIWAETSSSPLSSHTQSSTTSPPDIFPRNISMRSRYRRRTASQGSRAPLGSTGEVLLGL